MLTWTKHTQGGSTLIGRELIALLIKLFLALGVLVQDSGHLLIFNPLVTDKLESVIGRGFLEIVVGSLNKPVGQTVLFLKGGISQCRVIRILCKIPPVLTTQSRVKVISSRFHRRTDIAHHRLDTLHVLENCIKILDSASYLSRHIHKGIKLLGT